MQDEKFDGLIKDAQNKIGQTLDALGEAVKRQAAEIEDANSGGLDGSAMLGITERFAEATSQVELLNLLVELAAEYVPRALLMIRKGGDVHGWTGKGFSSEFSAGGLKRVKWSIDNYPELMRVAHQKSPLISNFSDLSDITEAIEAFDGFVPFKSSFFPLIVKNKVAAVLYVDSGSEARLDNTDLLQVFTYLCGVELTLVTSKLKAPRDTDTGMVAPKPAAAPPPSPPAPEPEPEPEPAAQPVLERPQTIPGPKVVSIPEIEPVQQAAPEPEPEPEPTFERSSPLPGSTASLGGGDEDPGVKKAKRVARVLVSDLKLYNEKACNEAKTKHNLYAALRDDLDRSYKHYQERVSGLLPNNETNYFKEELIRSLGDGDPDALGPLPF